MQNLRDMMIYWEKLFITEAWDSQNKIALHDYKL